MMNRTDKPAGTKLAEAKSDRTDKGQEMEQGRVLQFRSRIRPEVEADDEPPPSAA